MNSPLPFAKCLHIALLCAAAARGADPREVGSSASLKRAANAEEHGDPAKNDKYPASVSAGDTGEAALKKFSVAPGLRVDLWAAEPLLENAVAFSFDERGRAFVAESFRRRTSVPDIRKHMPWLLEDLALRTVADRVAFLKKTLAPDLKLKPSKEFIDHNGDGQFDWRDWAVESERIKLVEDSDGDGKADRASVFAEGFSSLETGVGAGVLAHGGDVFYTCAPDLWKISDGAKTKLLSGFAVHVAYGGHDLHGVKIGPDGKLYWTVADCGAHVTEGRAPAVSSALLRADQSPKTYASGSSPETRGSASLRVIDNPDSGAVFRANPDGSELELVMTGLRNPQSLAWNDVGDLFTGDNNADGGDAARWVHVVEGGDAGWRIGWQFLPKLGAWNSEKLWGLETGATALAQLPPVAHIGHGPAGIAHYPGTGLPAEYADHFFMADFPGGVRAFRLKQKGASYELDGDAAALVDNSQAKMTGKLLWGLYPSDVQFSTGGGVCVLDWVFGWEKTGKGRIFRVHDPATDATPLVQETRKLLAEGIGKRSVEELSRLLGHADQRVRLAAQFALVTKGAKGLETLTSIAKQDGRQGLARLHAIWGVGQILRDYAHIVGVVENGAEITTAQANALVAATEIGHMLLRLSKDVDAEVRAQSFRVLGEAKVFDWREGLSGLADAAPRVKFFAALALARSEEPGSHMTKDANALNSALFQVLCENANRDASIRHAAVLALARSADEATLAAAAKDDCAAIRTGALLALRRLGSERVAAFLHDKNPQIALEAARAIHDEPIPAALPALASQTSVIPSGASALRSGVEGPLANPSAPDREPATPATPPSAAFTRRVINANFRLGTAEAAQALAKIGAVSVRGKTGANINRDARSLDALGALAQWDQPLGRDRVLGLAIPLPGGRETNLAKILADDPSLRFALERGTDDARRGALEVVAQNRIVTFEPSIAALAIGNQPGAVRASALRALDSMNSDKLGDAVKLALASDDKTLLAAARQLAAKASPLAAVEINAAVLGRGSAREQQAALATIAAQNIPEADRVISEQLDRLLAGKPKAALQLDVLEAAAKRDNAAIKQTVAAFENARAKNDPLANWRECLEGGDSKAGREIFAEKAEVACMRCHKVKGEGGDVGPDLAGIGTRHDRAYILQSIIDPNAAIAPGYENVLLTLTNGEIIAGLLNAEDAGKVTIASLLDGKKQDVTKADIKERMRVPSAMPPGLGEVLGKRGLRDVVEYLAKQK